MQRERVTCANNCICIAFTCLHLYVHLQVYNTRTDTHKVRQRGEGDKQHSTHTHSTQGERVTILTTVCALASIQSTNTQIQGERERGGGDKHLTPSSVVQLTYKLTSCSSQHLPFLWELVTQRSNCTGVELIVRRMERLVQKGV